MERTFRTFDRYIDDIEASLISIHNLLEDMDQSAPDHGAVAALESLAELSCLKIGSEDIDLRPRDMIEEEWEMIPVKGVRTALWTLRLILEARPIDKVDWINEVRLAQEEFKQALIPFRRDLER